MTDDEVEKLLRESKAAWQIDGLGLRGSPTRFDPRRADELAPVQPFEVKEIDSSTITQGSKIPARTNLDSAYDGEQSGSNNSGDQEIVYGAGNGQPAILTVFATGPWTPV